MCRIHERFISLAGTHICAAAVIHLKASSMAKPNYQFEKRQREQQKKQKKVEKAQRKAQTLPAESAPHIPQAQGEAIPE